MARPVNWNPSRNVRECGQWREVGQHWSVSFSAILLHVDRNSSTDASLSVMSAGAGWDSKMGQVPRSRLSVISPVTVVCALALAAVGCAAGHDVAGPATVTPVATQILVISGNNQTGGPGAILTDPLVVKLADAKGAGVSGVTVGFSIASGGGTLSAAMAVSAADGTAKTTWTIGSALGPQAVTASAIGWSAPPVTFSAAIEVDNTPVASVAINFPAPTVAEGTTAALSASALSASGSTLRNRPVTWLSSNPAIASVGADGTLTGVAVGTATVTATVEGKSAVSPVNVVLFAVIAPGSDNTCAITTDGRLYCAGASYGPQAEPVSNALRFSSVSMGGDVTPTTHSFGCAVSATHAGYCWGNNTAGELGSGELSGTRPNPFPVAGGISFQSISAGMDFACGVAMNGDAYCWGNGGLGQLGGGSQLSSLLPARVASDQKFVQIQAAKYHVCGLTVGGEIYCWGRNELGSLGSGGTGPFRAVPGLVTGGLKFKSFTAHGGVTCGLTLEGKAYCWGNNTVLTLGASTTESCYGQKPCSSVPLAVNGDRDYVSIAASENAVCGVAADFQTYCWGLNQQAQFGIPSDSFGCATSGAVGGCTVVPVPTVRGFKILFGGARNYCGLDARGVGFCWGANDTNQLGHVTTVTSSSAPLQFTIDPLAPF